MKIDIGSIATAAAQLLASFLPTIINEDGTLIGSHRKPSRGQRWYLSRGEPHEYAYHKMPPAPSKTLGPRPQPHARVPVMRMSFRDNSRYPAPNKLRDIPKAERAMHYPRSGEAWARHG